eukprot:11242053-Karenia_brevis.AAC.1
MQEAKSVWHSMSHFPEACMKQKRYGQSSGRGDEQIRQWNERLQRLSCDFLTVSKSTDTEDRASASKN